MTGYLLVIMLSQYFHGASYTNLNKSLDSLKNYGKGKGKWVGDKHRDSKNVTVN